jgi:membrane fusion protein (multidrug efflux system)
MADPALKVVPSESAKEQSGKGLRVKLTRGRLRLMLLVVIPALALVAGLGVYLAGGRYITTDNAYVGAQKVLVTPDISGKIAQIFVKEGQRVDPGEKLFEIDPTPFELSLHEARSKLDSVRVDYNTLRSNYQATDRLIALAEKSLDLKQKDVDRKTTLVARQTGAQADVDTAMVNLVTAQNQLEQLKQQQAGILNQLKGNPELPIEQYAPFIQAKAALDQARRDLDHTSLRAPISGTATQVDAIQLGRYVTAGMPVFSIVDDSAPWVDANPKETDVTYLRIGQSVTVDVDAFPDHTFHGTVTSVSPGTGAQFAILPPQNASGNWVKVVQRLPLRVTLDSDPQRGKLRAGMSATVSIDTGRKRSVANLFGFASAAEIRQ